MKKNINSFKNIKIAELSFFVVLEIAFLVVLISNKTMRSSIFVDKSLFILCALMYITVLVSIGFMIIDFIKLRELKVEDHKLENLAFLDRKTSLPNRTSVNLMFENYRTPDSLKGIGCVVTEISNIKEINRIYGKSFGDKTIHDFSRIYERSAEGYGFVGRNGGNEFIAVIEKCNSQRMEEFIEKLNLSVDVYNEADEKNNVSVHSEYVLFDGEEVTSFSELVAKAYKKLGR